MIPDISQVKLYIQENVHSVRKTEQVAATLNCSLNKLKKTFYTAEKLSLSRFIRETRISRMKERLQSSDAPCKVICLDLGLREDVGARLFRSMTGLTMEEFRRMYRHGNREIVRTETLRHAQDAMPPRLVLTENVISHVLSTSGTRRMKHHDRRLNEMWIQGRAH